MLPSFLSLLRPPIYPVHHLVLPHEALSPGAYTLPISSYVYVPFKGREKRFFREYSVHHAHMTYPSQSPIVHRKYICGSNGLPCRNEPLLLSP